MESSRKRRTGFIKGKLMKSLYRAVATPVKPTTSPTNYYSSESDSPQTVYHLHLHHHQPKENLVTYNPNGIIIVNQEKAALPLKPKVSYYIPPQSTQSNGTKTRNNYYAKMDKSYGDESVDIKAANYISCVQERFKLERTC
ncbi:hypothetical protein RND71_032520 [Anisodus tanguticus]|uniref:Uncharacterized protein n=1 Tax=Anisodus tanguticus TaxID=243964 RepID=A0AAE1V0J5_9SOLA|nr:hypothetical protein RND71_032520 [Anisodus tanguticus]